MGKGMGAGRGYASHDGDADAGFFRDVLTSEMSEDFYDKNIRADSILEIPPKNARVMMGKR